MYAHDHSITKKLALDKRRKACNSCAKTLIFDSSSFIALLCQFFYFFLFACVAFLCFSFLLPFPPFCFIFYCLSFFPSFSPLLLSLFFSPYGFHL
jgi:hypothetical protein